MQVAERVLAHRGDRPRKRRHVVRREIHHARRRVGDQAVAIHRDAIALRAGSRASAPRARSCSSSPWRSAETRAAPPRTDRPRRTARARRRSGTAAPSFRRRPGISPTPTSTSPMYSSACACTRSACSENSHPPPSVRPNGAATTGNGDCANAQRRVLKARTALSSRVQSLACNEREHHRQIGAGRERARIVVADHQAVEPVALHAIERAMDHRRSRLRRACSSCCGTRARRRRCRRRAATRRPSARARDARDSPAR